MKGRKRKDEKMLFGEVTERSLFHERSPEGDTVLLCCIGYVLRRATG